MYFDCILTVLFWLYSGCILRPPGSILVLSNAERVPRCHSIQDDGDQSKLDMVVTETFGSLNSDLCADHFSMENPLESASSVDKDSLALIHTVCSPRGVEVVLPKTVIAVSCGGAVPMNVFFYSSSHPMFGQFSLDADIYNAKGVSCSIPGLASVDFSDYYLPASCTWSELLFPSEEKFFHTLKKRYERILRVRCAAEDLKRVTMYVVPNDALAVAEMNDVEIPYNDGFVLSDVYPFRWDVSSSIAKSRAAVWDVFESSNYMLTAALEINVGCGCNAARPGEGGGSSAAGNDEDEDEGGEEDEERRRRLSVEGVTTGSNDIGMVLAPSSGRRQREVLPSGENVIAAIEDVEAMRLHTRAKPDLAAAHPPGRRLSASTYEKEGGVMNYLVVLEKDLSQDYRQRLEDESRLEFNDEGRMLELG
eukprot:g8718.t1